MTDITSSGKRFRPIKQLGPDWYAGLVEVADGAQLYVETKGRGRPLILVHGWTMSGRFWKRQIDALTDRFQVVCPDLRAHGHSSKALHGHTVPQYAGDIRSVMDTLGLEAGILAGWSLAGPVVLEYVRRFEEKDLAGICLVEMTPAPFGSPGWNTHSLAGADLNGMRRKLLSLQADRTTFGRSFIQTMFHSGRAPEKDMAWMLTEHLSTPTSAAAAIYSDYLLRDHTEMLGRISVPALVINGVSDFLCYGEKTGRWVADRIPKGELSVFTNSGHMPFYEEPERFNQTLLDFEAKLG